MFSKLRNMFYDEQYRKLERKITALERSLQVAREYNFRTQSETYRYMDNLWKDERALRLKLVRVYEEKKVKYNALQGRYQSKADRLVNLNKQLLKEAQNEK